MQVVVQPGLYIAQLSTLQLYPRVATHIPQLWDFRMRLRSGVAHQLICQVVPSGIHRDLGIHQVLGHHGGLGQFPEMKDHALSLGNEVEVAAEGIRKPGEWMVLASDGLVLQALARDGLFTCLNSHLHEGNQSLVLRKAHFGLAHHEPLAARPGAGGVHEFRPIEDAHHANHGHGVLPKCQLFQKVVSLEHDIAHAGTSQPSWLIAFHLWGRFQVLGVNRI
mmetsp:Transcript_49756/g.101194  ORF Transcript_49756/g.101194 Transcript_49756/m.101194 type:complete len:221 (+) Transcript_49756:1484-2146(+)